MRTIARLAAQLAELVMEGDVEGPRVVYEAIGRSDTCPWPALLALPSDVAEGVWRAANDANGVLRFPADPDAVALARST